MANILDRYGIKEVADVTFYELDANGVPKNPVLFLDTLKVSTIEQTGEQTEARGGKGNPPLIIWDYGKEINVTLEDALFSAKSMAIMFGNGSVSNYSGTAESPELIMKTEQFVSGELSDSALPVAGTDSAGWKASYIAPDGKAYPKKNPKFFDENGKVLIASGTAEDGQAVWAEGKKYFCSYDLEVSGSIIDISANSFPGVYYVTGDTFARSDASGKDEFFQFIIPKAKVQSENTITMEAEGDPSVFNMSLRVLRPADGSMMKLVKYNLVGTASEVTAAESNLITATELSAVAQG